MRIVLDADVVIGALDASDDHHARARKLFTAWRNQDAGGLMSVVNLSEVLVAPAADAGQLRRARSAIAALGIAIHRPVEEIGVEAARLRNVHPISLADAYCIATAAHAGASVASFDGKVLDAAQAEGVALATEIQAGPG